MELESAKEYADKALGAFEKLVDFYLPIDSDFPLNSDDYSIEHG